MSHRAFRLVAGLALALLGSAPAAEMHHVYILTGQSNSLGAVKGTPATAEQLERYGSKGRLWNGNMVRDTGVCFDTSPTWQQVQPQLPIYNGNPCMGPEYGLCHMMQRRKWHTKPGHDVCIIKASLDGGGNSFWLPVGEAWKSLTATLKKALGELRGDTKVQALLYLQGESDKGEEITKAPERFLSLHSRLQKEVKKGLRYAVAGQCATWHQMDTQDAKGNTTAQLMYDMTRKKKSVGWVRTRDLTKITSGDSMGVHYDGKSQITIGARYAYAIALLEKLPLISARSDNPEAPLDAPAAWWGGKLPSADEVATWDVAAANAGDTLTKPLALGGLRVEDPFRGLVTIKGSSAKAALHIGAQGIQLREGDLALHCAVVAEAGQTWQLAAGRKLALGTPSQPVALTGAAGEITVDAAPDAVLELHLSAAPACTWRMAGEMPQVQATLKGRPAHFVRKGDAYVLE